jgi:hypothetical protein
MADAARILLLGSLSGRRDTYQFLENAELAAGGVSLYQAE